MNHAQDRRQKAEQQRFVRAFFARTKPDTLLRIGLWFSWNDEFQPTILR
jgi:hypothetical protein